MDGKGCFSVKMKYDLPCNIAQSLNLIGDRWTLLIIHEILVGNTTFNQIKKELNGISSNLLSDRLKYLEREKLVARKLYSSHPPRYEYTLTKSGEDLEHVFYALVIWGGNHLEKCYKKLVHTPTGNEVDIAYYSKETGEIVQDIEAIAIEELENTIKK